MLADLDELILRCRDERAKSHIIEAVQCYRGGAYRSAIVATWNAVCYDVIDKIRELSLSGDNAATDVLELANRARRANNISKLLDFERTLIDDARDKFEFISHIEHSDLDRLRQDRNRCAHPSFNSEEERFSASPELARTHIRAAINHLLEHPPTQGKAALERLVREVNSDLFPTEVDGAIRPLSIGPLRRPRDSLVRNFIIVLLKSALKTHSDHRKRDRFYAALGVVRRLHPIIFEKTFRENSSHIARQLEDKEIRRLLDLIRFMNDCWDWLDLDLHVKLENYILDMAPSDLYELDWLLDYRPLANQANRRLSQASFEDIDLVFWIVSHRSISNHYINAYLESDSFAVANQRGKAIIPYIKSFNAEQIRTILNGIAANSQIRSAFQTRHVINALRAADILLDEEVDAILEENRA